MSSGEAQPIYLKRRRRFPTLRKVSVRVFNCVHVLAVTVSKCGISSVSCLTFV